MTIKFTKQQTETGIQLTRDCLIANFDPKKDNGNNRNKSIFTLNANSESSLNNIGTVQEKLLWALTRGHIGYACDDPDGIFTLTEDDLKDAHKRFFEEKDSSLFRGINVVEFRYHDYAGVVNITTDNGDVLRVDLLTEKEIRDGADSSKDILKSNRVTNTDVIGQQEQSNNNKKNNELSDGYEELKNAVGMRESTNNYRKINNFGYLGRYQFGRAALIDLGYINKETGRYSGKNGIYSQRDFLNSSSAQDEAFNRWLPKLWGYLKKVEFKQANGTVIYKDATKFLNENGYVIIKGHKITASGLILGAHLKGAKAVYNYLKSNGAENETDGLGTSVEEYLRMFSGYNLDFV